jgi:hypothetical protein
LSHRFVFRLVLFVYILVSNLSLFAPVHDMSSPKNALQEALAKQHLPNPTYSTGHSGGPDHAPVFQCVLRFRNPYHERNSICITTSGSSKIGAEESAARAAVSQLATLSVAHHNAVSQATVRDTFASSSHLDTPVPSVVRASDDDVKRLSSLTLREKELEDKASICAALHNSLHLRQKELEAMAASLTRRKASLDQAEAEVDKRASSIAGAHKQARSAALSLLSSAALAAHLLDPHLGGTIEKGVFTPTPSVSVYINPDLEPDLSGAIKLGYNPYGNGQDYDQWADFSYEEIPLPEPTPFVIAEDTIPTPEPVHIIQIGDDTVYVYAYTPDTSQEVLTGSFNPYGNGQTQPQALGFKLIGELSEAVEAVRPFIDSLVFDQLSTITRALVAEVETQRDLVPLKVHLVSLVDYHMLSDRSYTRAFRTASAALCIPVAVSATFKDDNCQATVNVLDLSYKATARNQNHAVELAYIRLYSVMTSKDSVPLREAVIALLKIAPATNQALRGNLRRNRQKFTKEALNSLLHADPHTFRYEQIGADRLWSLI